MFADPERVCDSDIGMSLHPTEGWSFVPSTPGVGLTAEEWRARHVPGGGAAGEPDSVAAEGARADAPKTEDGFSFWDLLDVVNPLQHVPVIGAIYREVTGDDIGGFAKVVGGGLFGGVAGVVGGLVDVVVEAETGRSAEDHVLAWFDDDAPPAAAPAETMVARQDPAAEADGAMRAGAGPTAGARGGRRDAVTPPQEIAQAMPLGVLGAAALAPGAPGDASEQAVAAPSAARLAQMRSALEAQGLRPAGGLGTGNSAVAAQVEAARAGGGPATPPVDVPAWFDVAMQRAMERYQGAAPRDHADSHAM